MKKGILLLVGVAVLLAPMFAQGTSENVGYPDPEKTITVVCPQAAGGGTDLIARTLVEEMKKISGQNIIVTNITGAGTATGTNEVLNTAADGYMVLVGGTHTISATMQGLTEGYKALDYVASLNWDPFIIAVRRDKPWNTLKDIVEATKKEPGKITLGNAGMGGATGVVCVGLNLAFDKNFNVTPFNGGADLLANVLGGHCDAGIFSQSEVVKNIDQLKPIAILTANHSVLSQLADVPTIAESGYPGISLPGGSFRSFMVKKGTPEAIKEWLADITEKAFNSEAFQTFMKQNGLIPEFHKLEDYAAYDQANIKSYESILKEAGLYKI